MKIVTQFSAVSAIFMLLFNIASGAVTNDTSIVSTNDGFAMLNYVDGQGDTIVSEPCTEAGDASYVTSGAQCKNRGNTCNASCNKCEIVSKQYNCGGSTQSKFLTCICRANDSDDSNSISCTETPVLAGTNPCGAACISCYQRVCTASNPNGIVSGLNKDQVSGYICKQYANCPMINFKQYRSDGCSTEERKCCPTSDGRDWTAWARRAECEAPNNENSAVQDNIGNIKDDGGGFKPGGFK